MDIPLTTSEQDPEEEDESLGSIEELAQGEEAMFALTDTLGEMTQVLESVGAVAQEATRRMNAADARGAGFAGRLRETERLATELAEPAAEIERLGQAYAGQLVKVDPAVLTLIDMVEKASTAEREEANADEFFESIQGLTGSAGETIEQLNEFVTSLDGASKLSRGLRKPLRQMKNGLRGVIDGRAVMDEWDRRIAEASLDSVPPAQSDQDEAPEVADPAAEGDDADET